MRPVQVHRRALGLPALRAHHGELLGALDEGHHLVLVDKLLDGLAQLGLQACARARRRRRVGQQVAAAGRVCVRGVGEAGVGGRAGMQLCLSVSAVDAMAGHARFPGSSAREWQAAGGGWRRRVPLALTLADCLRLDAAAGCVAAAGAAGGRKGCRSAALGALGRLHPAPSHGGDCNGGHGAGDGDQVSQSKLPARSGCEGNPGGELGADLASQIKFATRAASLASPAIPHEPGAPRNPPEPQLARASPPSFSAHPKCATECRPAPPRRVSSSNAALKEACEPQLGPAAMAPAAATTGGLPQQQCAPRRA